MQVGNASGRGARSGAHVLPSAAEEEDQEHEKGKVGLVLTERPIHIRRIVPGSAADQARLFHVGDRVIEVDGKAITAEMELHEVANMFNGPPNSTLNLVRFFATAWIPAPLQRWTVIDCGLDS